MKRLLIITALLVTAGCQTANAKVCEIVAADGTHYYKFDGKPTKTLSGYVSKILPCKDNVMLIPYANKKGMKVFPAGAQCMYLIVKGSVLQTYKGSDYVEGEEICP